MAIFVEKGDITKIDCEAIVNPAKTHTAIWVVVLQEQ